MSYKTSDQIFDLIQDLACTKLKALDPRLTYHDIHHTMDVLEQSQRIAKEEGVTNERELYLLRIAALYHDTGFLRTYAKHEPVSCTIFLEDTEAFNFTEEEKKFVTGLIMATRLPQTPKTLHEKIICDADLDYLGRPDFLKIGDGLRKEFLNYGIIDSDEEWAVLQLKFLRGHHYHTASSQKTREAVKQQNIAALL